MFYFLGPSIKDILIQLIFGLGLNMDALIRLQIIMMKLLQLMIAVAFTQIVQRHMDIQFTKMV